MLWESLSLCTFPSLLPVFQCILPLLPPFKPNLARAENCWCTTRRVCKGCFSKALGCLSVMHHPLAKKIHHALPCLPPISHPHVLLHFLSLSPPCLHAEVGPAPGAVHVKHSCVPDTLCAASDSVWEVNSQWHVQYVAQMFLPPPALSHAIPSVSDKGYGLEIGGKWVKGRLSLTLLSSSYAPACSVWELGMGEGRWCVWRWINSISEEDFSEWNLEFLPKTSLQLFFGHCLCLGSRQRNFVLPNSLF